MKNLIAAFAIAAFAATGGGCATARPAPVSSVPLATMTVTWRGQPSAISGRSYDLPAPTPEPEAARLEEARKFSAVPRPRLLSLK